MIISEKDAARLAEITSPEDVDELTWLGLDTMTTLDFETLVVDGKVKWAAGDPVVYDPASGMAIFKIDEKGLRYVLNRASGLDEAKQADLRKLADFVRAHGSSDLYELATFWWSAATVPVKALRGQNICSAKSIREIRRQIMRLKKRTLVITAVVLVFATYLTSYWVLSRRGYREASRYELKGFYYFSPENSEAWRYRNNGCVVIFAPLNWIDRVLGFGRYPASEPLWGLGTEQR
jgi:hypothetical protein